MNHVDIDGEIQSGSLQIQNVMGISKDYREIQNDFKMTKNTPSMALHGAK